MYDIIISKTDLNFIIICFFLQNSADIKKIFLYYFLVYHYCAFKKIILCVIFFKITVLLLFKNIITHFKFKISLKCELKSIYNIN